MFWLSNQADRYKIPSSGRATNKLAVAKQNPHDEKERKRKLAVVFFFPFQLRKCDSSKARILARPLKAPKAWVPARDPRAKPLLLKIARLYMEASYGMYMQSANKSIHRHCVSFYSQCVMRIGICVHSKACFVFDARILQCAKINSVRESSLSRSVTKFRAPRYNTMNTLNNNYWKKASLISNSLN